MGRAGRMTNIDWTRVAEGCPRCKSTIQYHTLTAWCLKCGWAQNWTGETTVLATKDTLRELKHGMPTVAEDAADLRLLDLALSHALDNEAIHMGDPDKRARLGKMQERVLTWFREDV